MILERIHQKPSFTAHVGSRLVNTHTRTVAGDLAASQAVLDNIAGKGSVWPSGWPPLRLNRGLAQGSTGGHGSIRYTVTERTQTFVRFDAEPDAPFVGWHSFELQPVSDGVRWIHTLVVEQPSAGVRHLIVPLHDQVLEELLDNVEADLVGTTRPLAHRGPRVRALRAAAAALGARPAPDHELAERRPAAAALSAALLGLAALHTAWGLGSAWPARDRRQLARSVVGSETVPGPLACHAVATVLTGGAVLTQLGVRSGPSYPVARLGVRTMSATLATRGVAGLVVSGMARRGPVPFRRLDVLLYSPLCLALAATARRVVPR